MDAGTWNETKAAKAGTADVLGRCALLDAIGLSVLARLREQDALRGRLLFLEGRAITEEAGQCVCLDGKGTAHVGQNRIVLGDAEGSVLEFELSAWAGPEAQLLRGRLAPPDGHDVTVLAIHDVAPAVAGPASSFANTGFLTILGGTGCFKGANGIARFAATYEVCEHGLGENGARLRTAFTLDWVHWRRLPLAVARADDVPLPGALPAVENGLVVYQGGI
jgi:hypothetical protein